MRVAVGVGLLVVGVFLAGGPVFAVFVTLSGGDVFVRGGAARVVFDVVVGGVLVGAGVRRLTRPAAV